MFSFHMPEATVECDPRAGLENVGVSTFIHYNHTFQQTRLPEPSAMSDSDRSSNLSLSAVQSQEKFLRKHPILFRAKLVLLMLFGGVLFFGFLLFSLLLFLIVVALILSGKGLILLVHLLKVIWVLVFPIWGFLRIGWRMLTTRQPMPEGRWLRAGEAPALFARLDQMRAKMRGPKIDGVLLFPEMNAFAVSRPLGGFWFVPWRQRYIGMGVPLLQTLSEEEALAVVAHEYGHLSGHPSRFDAFVYRLRYRLIELWQSTNTWNDWPSRLLKRFLGWYIPRFDRSAFALCRASEYAADRASLELVGGQPAAEALMRVRVADAYIDQHFWRGVFSRVKQEADPADVHPWQQLPTIVRQNHDDDITTDLLRSAMQIETDTYDTHPALHDRLTALAFDTTPYQQRGQAIAPVADQTAAEAWFGDRLPEILGSFDQQWAEQNAEWWRRQHTLEQQQQARRNELEGKRSLSADEAWELLLLRINNDEVEDPDAEVRAFIDAHPGHPPSLLSWGRNNLNEQFDAALAAIHQAMRSSQQLAHEGALILADYFAGYDDSRSAVYRQMADRFAGAP